ncbi:MAG: hydrogenase maturation nickel metallochaperone HypA [Limisphaerales bacterium]|jgi:hydrogenase nickel incorporation protein HypA/HybF
MHEVGLMESVLELVESQVREAGASRAHVVCLRVGRLSGVVPEAMSTAFEVLRAGTVAEGGRLVIEDIPGACWCAACAAEFETEEWLCECPRCGEVSGDLRRGRELELASLEVS